MNFNKGALVGHVYGDIDAKQLCQVYGSMLF